MSFGWSATDVAALATLAYQTVQNCRKACGEYDDLTRQVQSLRGVIRKLRDEAANPKSLLNRPGKSSCWEELRPSLEGSREVLRSLNVILVKYASINRKDKMIGRLWTRAKFGNKELGTLNDLRQKARYYTGAISTLLNTVAIGSLGRIENSLDEAGLKDIKPAIEVIAERLISMSHGEGSVLTAYANDDRAVWKKLRRELIRENIVPSDIISKNKGLITRFIQELGERGVLDDPETQVSHIEGVDGDARGTCSDPEAGLYLGEDEDTNVEAMDELQDAPSASESQECSDRDSDHSSINDDPKISRDRLRKKWFLHPDSSRQTSDEEIIVEDCPDESRMSDYFDPSSDDASSDSSCSGLGSSFVHKHVFAWGPGSADDSYRPYQLSVVNMLIMDFGQQVPVLVANMSLLANRRFVVDNPFRNMDGSKDRTSIVFIGTPWGICLFVGVHNLSLYLENFKFFSSLLHDCLSSMESLPLVPNGALKHGETRHGLQKMTKRLQKCQSLAVAKMSRVESLCHHDEFTFPVIRPSICRSKISDFCDQFLQKTYDYWDSSGRSTMSIDFVHHEKLCTLNMVAAIWDWTMVFYLNCGDSVRCILTQTNPPRFDPIRLNQWIQQCAFSDSMASSSSDELSEGQLVDRTVQHDAEDGFEKKV